jgi:hypothetical protein
MSEQNSRGLLSVRYGQNILARALQAHGRGTERTGESRILEARAGPPAIALVNE